MGDGAERAGGRAWAEGVGFGEAEIDELQCAVFICDVREARREADTRDEDE